MHPFTIWAHKCPRFVLTIDCLRFITSIQASRLLYERTVQVRRRLVHMHDVNKRRRPRLSSTLRRPDCFLSLWSCCCAIYLCCTTQDN